MKCIIAAFMLPVALAAGSDITVSAEEISARDIAEIMGMHVTRLRIAHPHDAAIDLDIVLAVYREDSAGKVTKIRDVTTVRGTGNSPDWKHTFLTVGLCDGHLSVRTPDQTLRLPEQQVIPEFQGYGSLKTAYHPDATTYGYILFERSPIDSKDKYFIVATFAPRK